VAKIKNDVRNREQDVKRGSAELRAA